MVRFWVRYFILCLLFSGCSAPAAVEIKNIPKDHPAHQFYSYASGSIVSAKVCRDFKGSTQIPMGEIAQGEKYAKSEELTPGVFRFYEKVTGKKYLGVAYMKWSGFLLFPELCSWEES